VFQARIKGICTLCNLDVIDRQLPYSLIAKLHQEISRRHPEIVIQRECACRIIQMCKDVVETKPRLKCRGPFALAVGPQPTIAQDCREQHDPPQ
jgi:hypothetical protein